MDDESSSSGMGTLAAYTLGRMSVQTEQSNRNFARAMVRRLQPQGPTVDVNALLAENQALRQQVADYERNYRALKRWAEEAEGVLRSNGLIGN
ncbi:hypothetical protein [Roseomonas gilardii]|uniref:hypothetical protein n=1 Tax=Roseomonas gilardii TaxID=257708 RepID=UPI001C92C54C|nr:hypothetical protein [Roseomonas gilardii]